MYKRQEYTQRTQVKTDDEIGALSRSFDAMAAAVEGKINELSKTTQSQQDFIAAFTHEVKMCIRDSGWTVCKSVALQNSIPLTYAECKKSKGE